jgi:N6-adenosine-specific RNA methylase IME4
MTRYRTIVVDPPWEYEEGFCLGSGHGTRAAGKLETRPLPYVSMTLHEIKRLPVAKFADANCRLFLWTTNKYLRSAFDVLAAWGFIYRQTLVWHKRDANLPISVAPNSAEFVLVGTKGRPARLASLPSAVISTTRSGGHSRKPECWLDYFEQISPGPYAELFARRARFGWDYPIGDQALGGEVAACAS